MKHFSMRCRQSKDCCRSGIMIRFDRIPKLMHAGVPIHDSLAPAKYQAPIAPGSGMESLRSEAAQWVIRLESPTSTPKDWDAFSDWCALSPRNKVAFIRVRKAWREASALKRLRPLDDSPNPDLLDDLEQGLRSGVSPPQRAEVSGKNGDFNRGSVPKGTKR